jgi:rhodanese-related sulfurtransferase
MVSTISREQLKAKIDRRDPFILAEVLAPGQYERAHLPGAVNLPPDRVTALAATLLPDKHQEIVVYCGGST